MKTFIVALLFLPLSALALNLEGGCGQGFAQKAKDGDYYQDRHPHELTLQSSVCSLGFSDVFEKRLFSRNVRWRVFGRIMHGFSGTADALQDHIYDPRSPTGCVASGCETFSRYRTELSTRGIVGTLAYEFEPFRIAGAPLIVSPEAGVHVYMARFDEDVYTLDHHTAASSYRYYHYKWGWNAGEMYGVGASWKYVRLSVHRYKINMANRGDPAAWQTDTPSPVGELVNEVKLTLSIPL